MLFLRLWKEVTRFQTAKRSWLVIWIANFCLVLLSKVSSLASRCAIRNKIHALIVVVGLICEVIVFRHKVGRIAELIGFLFAGWSSRNRIGMSASGPCIRFHSLLRILYGHRLFLLFVKAFLWESEILFYLFDLLAERWIVMHALIHWFWHDFDLSDKAISIVKATHSIRNWSIRIIDLQGKLIFSVLCFFLCLLFILFKNFSLIFYLTHKSIVLSLQHIDFHVRSG